MDIIQVGCHTGNDAVFAFAKSKQDKIKKLILIDALASSVDLCKKFYEKNLEQENFEKLIFVKKAIVDDDTIKEIDFFVTENEHEDDGQIGYTAFSSVDINHLNGHNVKNIKKISVPAVTLNEILKEHSLSRVDRLFLDAEGLDGKILLSLDLENIDIPFICFEGVHIDGTFRGMHQKVLEQGSISNRLFHKKLKPNGYEIFAVFLKDDSQYDYNHWAIKSDQENLIGEIRESLKHKNVEIVKYNI
jgi:FkbM family methyltransferase